jgi:hypothetical protein
MATVGRPVLRQFWNPDRKMRLALPLSYLPSGGLLRARPKVSPHATAVAPTAFFIMPANLHGQTERRAKEVSLHAFAAEAAVFARSRRPVCRLFRRAGDAG